MASCQRAAAHHLASNIHVPKVDVRKTRATQVVRQSRSRQLACSKLALSNIGACQIDLSHVTRRESSSSNVAPNHPSTSKICLLEVRVSHVDFDHLEWKPSSSCIDSDHRRTINVGLREIHLHHRRAREVSLSRRHVAHVASTQVTLAQSSSLHRAASHDR